MNTQRIIERIESWKEKQTDSYVKDAYLQCLSIIKEEIEQSNWQPIETAPKDGTNILAPIGYGFLDVIYWDNNNWRETSDGKGLRNHPTHWMSLPNPPEKEQNQ